MANTSTYLDAANQAVANAGLTGANNDKATITGIFFTAAVILTVASACMNILFALSIAQSFTAGLLLASVYLAFDLFKIAAPSAVWYLYAMEDMHVFAAVISFGFVLAVAASLVSGTGFMASVAENAENSRLAESSQYQNNIAAQQRLQQKAEANAISDADIRAAQTKLAELQQKRQQVYADYSAHMTEDGMPIGNYPSWARRGRAALQPVDDAIDQQQRRLEQGKIYGGAVARLEHVQAEQPTATTGGVDLPVFVNLARYFDTTPVYVRTQVLTWTSITTEVIAGLCWLVYGRLRSPRELTAEEVSRAQYRLNAQHQLLRQSMLETGSAFVDIPSPTNIYEAENVSDNTPRNTESQAQTRAAEHNRDWGTLEDDGRHEVGKLYMCITEGCENSYRAKTTWHKKCHVCRDKKEAPFRSSAAQKASVS